MKRDSGKVQFPAKRIRDRGELEEQARLFGQDWDAGDRVQTWLVRHEGKPGELGQMVKDGRSWTDIGRALHIGGITCRTGEPISAAVPEIACPSLKFRKSVTGSDCGNVSGNISGNVGNISGNADWVRNWVRNWVRKWVRGERNQREKRRSGTP
jgi:hypothetical protein